jgi:hypothetical protein
VEIISLYLEGKAEVWSEGLLIGDHDLTNWEEFVRSIYIRFGSRKDVVDEFNKLIQNRAVKEYVERFEEFKSLISIMNPSLT